MAIDTPPTDILGGFKFLKPSEVYQREKLYTLNYDPGDGGIERTNIKLEERSGVPITDLRGLHHTLSWQTSGIAVKTISPVLSEEGFRDDQKIEEHYYPEIERVLQKMLQPSKLVVLEHKVRRRHATYPMATGDDYEHLQPTSIVHVDYSETSVHDAAERLEKLNPAEFDRIVAVNVWKPLRGPLRDWPLALCDASTVDREEDLVAADVVDRHGFSENCRVYHNQKQKWYYLSEQSASEILIFRQWDTKGGLNPVPHSGFQLPDSDPDASPRESIELRALLCYH